MTVEAPAPTASAVAVFGTQLALVERYAHFLAAAGSARGLIGPREVPRLWERHLLNCAPVAELLPHDARVVDIGSGAGLPGLVLACLRPDLKVDLVESLRRRTDFLTEAVELLGLSRQVRVVRGRAEDTDVIAIAGDSKWVTARAVAPLDKLARWSLGLLVPGGRLLAMKGESAATEVDDHSAVIRKAGGRVLGIEACGDAGQPVRVVVIERLAREIRSTK